MKNYLLFITIIFWGVVSCNRSGSDSDTDPGNPPKDSLGSEIFLTIGNNVIFDYSDLGLYDSSTHIVYFMYNHPEFDKIRQLSFVVYADGDSIYKGEFWPGYYSSLPFGPYIPNMPLSYKNYVLRIDYRENGKPDLRNDPRIIRSLKNRDLLHSGLLVTISSLEISGSLSRLSFVVTNMDVTELLILDPDKMGHKLFHYFTNGLYLKDLSNNTLIQSVLESQAPSPWNSWSMDWLTKLNPGESRKFTLSYSFSSAISPGDYKSFFEYPGLSYQVAINELFQATGRIWLGDITVTGDITVR